jgi:membrane protein
MVAPAIPTQAGSPVNAFSERLRWLPRRPRLLFLILFRTVSGFVRHDGLSWSAAMAFWLVLSLPPLLIALSSVSVMLLGQESAQRLLTEQIAAQLPAEGGLIGQIADHDVDLMSAAGLGSLVFLMFSGSRVFGSLVLAINVMWRHVEGDGFLRRQIMRGVMVLLVGGMLLASVVLQLGILGAEDDIGALADVLARYLLPFMLVVGGLFLAYKLVPNGCATWRTALVGAVLTAAVLRIAQFTFWFMLNNVVDYDTGYGPLAGIAILMTWAVVASAIVLLGAEFVATLDRHRLRRLPLPSSATGEPSEQTG